MSTSAKSSLKVGKRELDIGGKYLDILRESNDALHDIKELQKRMTEDGYLFIRGLQKRENVAAARKVVLENLDKNGQINRDFPLDEGIPVAGARGAFLGGAQAITHTPEFLGVVDSPEIMGFFDKFFDEPSMTFDFKWLRAVGPGGYTGAHYDVVYMGLGSGRLHTVWTPLGDVSLDLGGLCVLGGSHNLESFAKLRSTYGKMDVDRDNVQGWFSDDPVEMVDKFGGKWLTSDFRMGDVIIFGMFTMHGSVNNTLDRYRLSCDTRYQPKSDPVDERWIGKNPKAHYAWGKTPGKTMEDAKKEWGV